MLSTTTVVFSSPVLSIMALESFVTQHKEGYLIGRVTVQNSIKISDSEGEQRVVTTTIAISQFMPARVIDAVCSAEEFNFDGIEKQRAQNAYGEPQLKVVGWFRSRRNSPLVPSLREQIAHRRLLEARARAGVSQSSAEPLVFSLFVHTKAAGVQHFLDYAAFVTKPLKIGGAMLGVVDARVANLGDASQSAYQFGSTFTTDLSEFACCNAGPTDVVSQVTALHRSAQSYLATLRAEIMQATLKRLALREEILRLEHERLALRSNGVEDEYRARERDNATDLQLQTPLPSTFSRHDNPKRASCNLISFGEEESEQVPPSSNPEKEWVQVDPYNSLAATPPSLDTAPPPYSLLDAEDNWQQVGFDTCGLNTAPNPGTCQSNATVSQLPSYSQVSATGHNVNADYAVYFGTPAGQETADLTVSASSETRRDFVDETLGMTRR